MIYNYYPAILVEVSLWVIPASPCLGRTVETIFFSSSIASHLTLNSVFHNVTTGPGISSPGRSRVGTTLSYDFLLLASRQSLILIYHVLQQFLLVEAQFAGG